MPKQKNCDYCGWKFPPNFIQNISNQSDTVFCENCGTEIVNYNDYTEKNVDSNRLKAKSKPKAKGKSKGNSKVGRFYDKLRSGKDPVDRVLYDSDFPLIFKENFILVLCRIIHDSLSTLVDISLVRVGQTELSEALINETENDLAPTMNMRIEDEFTVGLHKISRKQFENHLKRFQAKIEGNSKFKQNYSSFLRWLIEMVYELISTPDDLESLPKMQQIILKDIRRFNNADQENSDDLVDNEPIIKRKKSKYWFLDEDEKGNPLTLNEQRIKGSAKYVRDVIIPDLIDKNIIEPNQRPTTQNFKAGKWSKFLYQLHQRKIDFKLVMAEMGFQKFTSKYSFMYFDQKGNPLSRFEKIREAKKYFESTIIPSLIKENLIEAGQVPSSNILEQTPHDNFLEALYKKSGDNCKIFYKDFIWWSGYDNVMGNKIWIFLDRDEYGNDLDYEGKVNATTDYFVEKIVPDLIDKEYISETQIPLQRDLNKPEYYLFVKAFRRRGIHFGHILENAGYLYEDEYEEKLTLREIEQKIKEVEQDRDLFKSWEFLYKKQDDSMCSRGETLNLAADYMLETIIPELINNKIISHNETPRLTDVAKNGYGGFLTTLSNGKWSIRYNEILQVAGFKLNKDTISYSFLDKGKVIKQQTRLASNYFKDNIMPELIRQSLISKEQSPTKNIIKQTRFKGFIWAIEGRGIRYNKILELNSYNVNRPSFKWDFLFENEKGYHYSLKETLSIASEYFKKNIIAKLLDEGKIVEGQIPFREVVHNFSGFLYALWDSPFQISYTELVESSGLIPNSGPILTKVGMNFHHIAEKLFLQHTRGNNCNSFYEALGFDNVIYIDEGFKGLSKNAEKLVMNYKDIKIVIIDYYLGNTRENIGKHVKRGYQDEDKLLILVPVFAEKSSKLPDNNNVELLSPSKFADLIGYEGELRSIFFEAIGLAKEAVYNLDARLTLRKKAVRDLRIIKETYPYKEKEFLDFIRKSN
ncbi:MAG: hypothetical protein ACFFE4_18895 [Candidatus Thorarchaeota archaeon]